MKTNLPYYKMDANAFRQNPDTALRAIYGWDGYGRYRALLDMIADADRCVLDLSKKMQKLTTAGVLGITPDELEKFLSFLSDPEECGLLIRNGDTYTTSEIQENLQFVMKERIAARDRKTGKNEGQKSSPELFKSSTNFQEVRPEFDELSQSSGEQNKKSMKSMKGNKENQINQKDPIDTGHSTMDTDTGRDSRDWIDDDLISYLKNQGFGFDFRFHQKDFKPILEIFKTHFPNKNKIKPYLDFLLTKMKKIEDTNHIKHPMNYLSKICNEATICEFFDDQGWQEDDKKNIKSILPPECCNEKTEDYPIDDLTGFKRRICQECGNLFILENAVWKKAMKIDLTKEPADLLNRIKKRNNLKKAVGE